MPPRANIPVIGLVGGIGSGKSALAERLARYRKTVLIDADRIGHDVLKSQQIKTQIRERFGPSVFDGEAVSRPALAKLVFGDSPESIRNRQDLESIVHPVIEERIRRRIDDARRLGAVDVIILDAAILLEAGWNQQVDRVVYVDVADEIRLARVQSTRGWNADDLTLRERSQLPLEEKRAAADWTVTNNDSIEAAARQLDDFIQQFDA